MVLSAQQAAQPAAVYLLEHHFHTGHVLSDSFFRYPMVPWVWEITSFLLRLLAESASRQEMMAYFLAVFLGLGSSSYKPALGWACSSHPS